MDDIDLKEIIKELDEDDCIELLESYELADSVGKHETLQQVVSDLCDWYSEFRQDTIRFIEEL